VILSFNWALRVRLVKYCEADEPQYDQYPFDNPSEAIVSHRYAVHEQGQECKAEHHLGVYEGSLTGCASMRKLDSVGYARGESESELKKSDTKSEYGNKRPVEFGIDGGSERTRIDEMRLEVWWRRHLRWSILR